MLNSTVVHCIQLTGTHFFCFVETNMFKCMGVCYQNWGDHTHNTSLDVDCSVLKKTGFLFQYWIPWEGGRDTWEKRIAVMCAGNYTMGIISWFGLYRSMIEETVPSAKGYFHPSLQGERASGWKMKCLVSCDPKKARIRPGSSGLTSSQTCNSDISPRFFRPRQSLGFQPGARAVALCSVYLVRTVI